MEMVDMGITRFGISGPESRSVNNSAQRSDFGLLDLFWTISVHGNETYFGLILDLNLGPKKSMESMGPKDPMVTKVPVRPGPEPRPFAIGSRSQQKHTLEKSDVSC
jgi:hypothetical protein